MSGQHQASQAKGKEASRKQGAMMEAQLQQTRIASAQGVKPFFESLMDSRKDAFLMFLFGVLVFGGFFLHQVHDQRGDQRPGKEVGGQQREYDRFGQRHKEIAGHSWKEKHGYEDDADREGGAP